MKRQSSVRRIVTIDDDNGKSVAIHDGPTPDVRTDPARPGFASMRIWVTDTTPASDRARPRPADAAAHASSRRRADRSAASSPSRRTPRSSARSARAMSRRSFAPWGHRLHRPTRPRRRIPTCRRRARSIFASSWRARSRWCSTPPRCSLRPGTRWCNGEPITPGAIDQTDPAPSQSHHTTLRIEVTAAGADDVRRRRSRDYRSTVARI